MRQLLACLALWLTLAAAGCRSSVDRSTGQLPTLQVPRATKSIAIDGVLDEWKEGGTTGAFVSPGSGKSASGSPVAAEARLCYDDKHLYVAFKVADPAPSSPFTRHQVDPHIWARASGVELMLQPGDHGDNRDYFEVQVDVALAVWDTRFADYNRPIIKRPGQTTRFGYQAWRSQVERAVKVQEGQGYVLELALPWRAFAVGRGAKQALPPRSGDVWRANFYAFKSGQRHATAWSPLLGQGNFHKASRFGRLRF